MKAYQSTMWSLGESCLRGARYGGERPLIVTDCKLPLSSGMTAKTGIKIKILPSKNALILFQHWHACLQKKYKKRKHKIKKAFLRVEKKTQQEVAEICRRRNSCRVAIVVRMKQR